MSARASGTSHPRKRRKATRRTSATISKRSRVRLGARSGKATRGGVARLPRRNAKRPARPSEKTRGKVAKKSAPRKRAPTKKKSAPARKRAPKIPPKPAPESRGPYPLSYAVGAFANSADGRLWRADAFADGEFITSRTYLMLPNLAVQQARAFVAAVADEWAEVERTAMDAEAREAVKGESTRRAREIRKEFARLKYQLKKSKWLLRKGAIKNVADWVKRRPTLARAEFTLTRGD